jgi:chromosome partitioning protein
MKLREAPAAKQSIFEYAPDSHGAEDYAVLVDRVLAATASGRREDVGAVAQQVEV